MIVVGRDVWLTHLQLSSSSGWDCPGYFWPAPCPGSVRWSNSRHCSSSPGRLRWGSQQKPSLCTPFLSLPRLSDCQQFLTCCSRDSNWKIGGLGQTALHQHYDKSFADAAFSEQLCAKYEPHGFDWKLVEFKLSLLSWDVVIGSGECNRSFLDYHYYYVFYKHNLFVVFYLSLNNFYRAAASLTLK